MTETKQILNKFLKQIAIEKNYVDHDLKIETISSGGANFMTTLFDITFTKGGKDVYMFAKVAAIGEKMRSQAPKVFKTENFAYTKLAKVYEQIEEEHKIPEEHSLAFAKFYGCNPKSYEETIVLENLFKSGFEAYDRFKTISKEYAFSAMKELAKFHALSLAYAEYYPDDFGEVAEELKFEWDLDSDMMAGYFDKVIGRALLMTKEENKEKLKRFFDEQPKNMMQPYMIPSKRPVLGHGDYRPNNLMHRNREDGSVDIKIVDLQTLQASTPIVDLLYFIFTGSDEQFRAQYYDQLIDHYYTQLHDAMKRLHLDPENIYSRQDFDNELKEKLSFGLVIAIFALPLVTVDVENAPEVNEDLDLTNFALDKTNDMYTERLNGVVNDYIKWGILK